MSKFLGTLQEIEQGSWRAAGSLTVEKSPAFNTACKPRLFTNEAAGSAFLGAWALRHNAAEISIAVDRLDGTQSV